MSSSINIPGTPNLPNIGYYDSNTNGVSNNKVENSNFTSYDHLEKNLKNTCINSTLGTSLNVSSGIYNLNNINVKKYLPDKDPKISINSLDIPFYLAKEGVLLKNPYDANNDLINTVNSSCNGNQQNLVNQIQYLTCQLEQERNRVYDSNSFISADTNNSVTEIFNKFPNLKVPLILIFFISMYLGVSGFFGSIDLGGNIFNIIEKKSKNTDMTFWIGLLVGLIVPVAILAGCYAFVVCNNLKDLEKYEITNNSYGVFNTISSELKNFDILTLVLFIFLIYSLVGVLFTIKKSSFSSVVYSSLIGIILLIIAILIYVFYKFIPFFNTADSINMMEDKAKNLQLFIDSQQNISNINTNQTDDKKTKKVFAITAICIFILAIIFFIVGKQDMDNTPLNGFINGFLGSAAILVLPIIWVFNFCLILGYFYAYPILLIIIRFIRYIIMSILYIQSANNPSFTNNMSNDLSEQLNNFKNYTAPWGLIGVDEIKLLLNVLGYENIFSKEIMTENSNIKNVSNNRVVTSLSIFYFISLFIGNNEQGNMKGIIYGIIVLIITIVISSIIVFGIAKQK